MISTINEAAVALSRWVELSILGKATIMLLIGLTVVRLAGRARASVRHLLLTATFATVFALPLIVLTAPEVMIGVPVSQAGESITAPKAVTPSDALTPPPSSNLPSRATESASWSALSWITIIRLAWIAGAMLLLAQLAIDLWRLYRIRRDGLPWPERRDLMQSLITECGIRRPVEILLHEGILAPLTYGVWRPAILLPYEACEWSEADLRRAIVHELEHVRRGDWAIQLAARATCVFYWFHPLVWVAFRGLSLEAERACDDAVVRSAERTEYAEQLVLLAGRLSKAHAQPALGMANRSDLSTRVSALLDGSQRRGRAGLLAAASALSVASLVVLAIAPVRAVTLSRKPTVASAQAPGSETRTRQQRVSSALDRKLIDAAESGNTSGIDDLLSAGANVNCALEGDGSPLIISAGEGHLAAVRLLLDRGADPNLSVSGDGSPLIMAAGGGHVDVVSLLLDRGADPNMPVPGDGNPLIMAAGGGHLDVVSLLLDRGASIDQIVPGDENALIQASETGHLKVVKLLVARGADVNARAEATKWKGNQPISEWRTPLGMARRGGHKAVVDFLIASGARE
ncbi:MAG: M56 family metallopeptidase [Acidobacteriota bacterium]